MGDTAPSTGLKTNAERGFPRTIAVDGSAASGKSSVGREVARRLGYPFLDTGVMYRAVTLAAIERGVDPTDEEALGRLARSIRIEVSLPRPGGDGASRVRLDGRDVTAELRRPDVEQMVSLVSRVPAVREALVALQRKIAGEQPMVMAGRDIGTVVLPDADLKVYLDASLAERARRRHEEFARQGREVSEEAVLDDIRQRDLLDSTRDVSPLRPADDAVVINSDGMTLEQVVDAVMELVEGWK